MAISGSNLALTAHLGGLYPSSPYNCCASAVYTEYVARRTCANIETPGLICTTESPAASQFTYNFSTTESQSTPQQENSEATRSRETNTVGILGDVFGLISNSSDVASDITVGSATTENKKNEF